MSDTDDTDDLLLIPPDFFAIESDSGQSHIDPYYNIVDSLIEQVGNLQNRIKSIESCESFPNNSFDSSSIKKHKMQKHIKEFRKYNSSDDLHVPSSVQSTPKKHHTKFQLNSLPTSPYVDRLNFNQNFSEYGSLSPSPIKNKQTLISQSAQSENNTLSEVDTFLSNVKTIQRLNAVRNLENEFNCSDKIISNSSKSNSTSKDGVITTNTENEVFEPIITKDNIWQPGENKESVPNYGSGIRDLMYNSQKNGSPSLNDRSSQYPSGDHKHLSNLSSNTNDYLVSCDQYPESETSTSDSISQVTTFQNYNKSELLNDPLHTNALNILNMHKQLTSDGAKKVSKSQKRDKVKSSNYPDFHDNLGLLNLADIWNTTSSQLLPLNPSQLLQKLQEEKLRRQHCEDLIQDLQNRNLEVQQKLSVAVRVDDSKNKTITQFQETLQKLMNKMQILQKEKRECDNEKSRIKARHSNEVKENMEKIKYYEKEVSKVLNIAHSNHEKMVLLEKTVADLQSENQLLKKTQVDLEDSLFSERNKNMDLSEITKSREKELSELKETVTTVKTEIDKTNRTIASYQVDFAKMKNENDRLQDDLKKSNSQVIHYEEQQNALLGEIEELKKRENKLKDDLSITKKHIEQNKIELRNFYQGQVEILVQNKLKEFQAHLDKSDSNFREEIKKREMSIAKTAALHIQQLSEKYSMEIKLLEKKHEEESKLYQVQIMQYKQQIEDLESRLDHFQEKRVIVAKQLQKFMETQWTEALRIIASGRSPTFNTEDSFSKIDQLNTLKTRSYNNLEEILSKHGNFHSDKDKGTYSNEESKSKNQQEEFKVSMETPVSSKTHGNDHEVQKYINLLLNRQTSEGTTREPDHMGDYDSMAWSNEQGDGMRTNRPQKDRKNYKPPWK